MSSVEDIQRAVCALSRDELAAFRAWFLVFDAEVWDREIEQDAAAGRLDALAAEALAEHRRKPTQRLSGSGQFDRPAD